MVTKLMLAALWPVLAAQHTVQLWKQQINLQQFVSFNIKCFLQVSYKHFYEMLAWMAAMYVNIIRLAH